MMSNRRQFMTGLGALTLGNFITGGNLLAANPLPPTATHFAPRAKRIIFLFMAGAPSQIETFDYKPGLDKLFDQDLPDSIRQGQRVTAMTKNQTRFPVVPSVYNFAQHGQSGAWVSELLPHTATMVDDLAIVRSVYTEAINHDPAKTLICTGNQLPGQASLGAWLSYALGSDNPDLPGFIVLNSATWSGKANVQALFSRLWGSGYLPTKHQGVTFRPNGDPVLYLSNPEGVSRAQRRTMLDLADALNRRHHQEIGDPEILTTIAQQDMAYRMQVSVPDLVDVSEEPEHVRALYGPQVDTPGTFAHNCLLARRMAERDVRCVQVFHRGWDHHRNLPTNIKGQSKDVDQASHGLIQDLKQRGLGLGRRVRPHRLLPRQAGPRGLRPRPPPALLLHVAGRRRDQAGHRVRRNRRLQLQRRSRPGACPRPERHHPASTGLRP